MRALLGCLLVLSLAVSPAIAGTDGSEAAATATGSTSSSSTSGNSSAAAQPAAVSAPAANTAAKPAAASMEDELGELRDQMDSQAKQIQEQNDQLKAQQQKVKDLEEQLNAVNSGKEALTSSPATAPTSLTITPKNVGSPTTAAAQISNATSPTPEVSPLQLKIGSAYITPVGFMDFTGVWRSVDGGSGIGTNFAGIPYGGSSVYQTNLSELRFSMQNSRIGFRVDANVKGARVIGYMEADFLGNNPTNVAVSSNSNTLRSRLYWVDLRKSSWELLGGQTWSLATPNRVGVSPLPGDVFFSYNMDVNYQLGMVWGRIPELRVAYHLPNDKAAFAIALDSPDQYMGGTNGSTGVTLPGCCSYYAGGELDNGTTTLGPANIAPDVIAKFVADPSKRLHVEVGGIARFFQLYNQTAAAHHTATGGAGFVNLDVGIFGGLRFLTHNYWSDGGGRYIFGQAPDLAVRADGSPSLLHAGSTTDGFEYTRNNTTLFAYYGLVYVGQDQLTDINGCPIGYGYFKSSLTGCTAPSTGQNRTIQEGTLGFINNFWKDSRYGALSLIGQYSYLTRDPWYVATGQSPSAHTNMVFLDLRYTLPGSAPTLGKPGKE